jgi:hypothetical protein
MLFVKKINKDYYHEFLWRERKIRLSFTYDKAEWGFISKKQTRTNGWKQKE